MHINTIRLPVVNCPDNRSYSHRQRSCAGSPDEQNGSGTQASNQVKFKHQPASEKAAHRVAQWSPLQRSQEDTPIPFCSPQSPTPLCLPVYALQALPSATLTPSLFPQTQISEVQIQKDKLQNLATQPSTARHKETASMHAQKKHCQTFKAHGNLLDSFQH